jgi:mRNA interferase MazF
MDEIFNKWNDVKKIINKKENKVGFKEREIFWLRLGQNIGNEEFGKGNEFQRPVLVIKKLTKNIFIGVPFNYNFKRK